MTERIGHGRPRLELLNLGSGSSGNCSLVLAGEGDRTRRILVDCGFSMRRTSQALLEHDIELQQLDGIVLTPLDRDHFNPAWSRRLRQLEVPVHVCTDHAREAVARGCPEECLHVFDDVIEFGESLTARTHLVAHDDSGCVAYRFEFHGRSIGFATDLGHVPDSLLSFLEGVDAIAFESNYDRSMQLLSDRPEFLKQRIMGGHGHLSNEQSLHAVLHIDRTSDLQHVVLLHLSRQCNEPERIMELYRACAPHLVDRLVITKQHSLSQRIEIKPTSGSVDAVPDDLDALLGEPLKETG